MTYLVRTPNEMRDFGGALAPFLGPGDVVLLAGDLGAGKTTLVQGIAAGLDVNAPVTSPTFTIVQEYEGRVPVAHVDVYRLDRFRELQDLGMEEMLEERVTLVEWGDVVAQAFSGEYMVVRITVGSADDHDDAVTGSDSSDGSVSDTAARELALDFNGESWRARRARMEDALDGYVAGTPTEDRRG